MRPAANLESFLCGPDGRTFAGARWLVFADGPVSGLVVWESPSRDEAHEIIRTLPASLARGPHAYFIDARRMTGQPQAAAFEAFVEEVLPSWPRYREHVTRCAVVLPPGMAGAAMVGFFQMSPPPFEVRFFAEPLSGLAFAGDPEPARRLATLDHLQECVSGTPALLFRLRSLLDEDPAGAEGSRLAAVARTLGLSTRSLQRRLVETQTTFRKELLAARLRKAQGLLAGTDLKVTAVAHEVGCASSQHLSALFRRMTGESPTTWRATHRRAREILKQ